jgi:leader peptidase (prepilin peptidase) / N-methyltransferase
VTILGATILGLFAGSLIWMLADKIIRGGAFSFRPVCLDCGVELSWWRWLPLTWLLGRGWCPACGAVADRSGRAWEIAVAAYFAFTLAIFDPSFSVTRTVIAILPILLILAIEIKVQAVFVQVSSVAVVVGLFLGFTESATQAANAMFGMLIAIVVIALFIVITRWVYRSLSLRSVPLTLSDLVVGAAVGALVRADGLVPALVVAVVLATIATAGAPILAPRFRSRVIPFGPFLCLGGLFALMI